MVSPYLWVILGLAIVFGTITISNKKNNGKKDKTDYYAFFLIGTTMLLPFGILVKIIDPKSSTSIMFVMLGIIYSIIGLKNKDKWKQNRKSFEKLNKKEKRTKLIIIITTTALLLIFLIMKYFIK